MIDLGLTKIAVIGVVALIVIGPEKLPKVARMAGTLYGRAQRYLHDVKSEVSREIELDELRNLQKEVQETAQSFRDEVEHNINEVEAAWDDEHHRGASSGYGVPPSPEAIERKARDFRRKKLVRTTGLPVWYKSRHGGRAHVLSGAARVRKYRPGKKSNTSFF